MLLVSDFVKAVQNKAAFFHITNFITAGSGVDHFYNISANSFDFFFGIVYQYYNFKAK